MPHAFFSRMAPLVQERVGADVDHKHKDLLAGVVVAGEVLGLSTLGASRFFPPVTGYLPLTGENSRAAVGPSSRTYSNIN